MTKHLLKHCIYDVVGFELLIVVIGVTPVFTLHYTVLYCTVLYCGVGEVHGVMTHDDRSSFRVSVSYQGAALGSSAVRTV